MRNILIEMGLEETTVDKVMDVFANELKNKYVPISRFTEVNDAKKKFEADVAERDTQLETLKNATGDVDKLKKQIEALQADNQKAKDEYNANLKAMRREDFVKTTLMEAGLLDAKYIPGVSAYLPISDLDIDNVTSVETFKTKIADVKTIASAWFKSDEPPTKEIGGLKLNDPNNKVPAGTKVLEKDSYEYFLSQVNN